MHRWCFLLRLTLVSILFFSVTVPVLSQGDLLLLLHTVNAQPASDGTTNEVTLFFSLLDGGGNPIRDAQADHFVLFEDGQQVAIASLAPVSDHPIYVLLLLDTSGSMAGEKITASRQAAGRFIENLRAEDSVAVLTFDSRTETQIEFTTDHQAAREIVELVQATPNGTTCLYDAAYKAVQMISTLPAGRRAIVLLTDGIDDSGKGRPCSTHTLEEVVALASQPKSRVPIYTIGLGRDVDQKALEQIARRTQGRFQYAPGSAQLDALFNRLSDELRSQYRLLYRSTASPGEHTLTLRVTYRNISRETSGVVNLPPLPYRLNFLTPSDGSEVQGPLTIQVRLTGQGVPIRRILFLVNGIPLGTDETPPYEISWDPLNLVEGAVLLEAVAQDASGMELARSAITVTYRLPPPPTPSTSQPSLPISNIVLFAVGSILLLVAIFIPAVVFIQRHRQKQQQEREKEWLETVQKGTAPVVMGDEHTLDSLTPHDHTLAVLVVLQSDDPELIHRRLEITKPVTTLGRKRDNDLAFPKDSPVSRQHAVIEERNGIFYLSEIISVDERGHPKPPAYGTFVNGMQVRDPVRLRDGDEIQLGKRLRLRFEAVRRMELEDRTVDQVLSDEDRTIDLSG